VQSLFIVDYGSQQRCKEFTVRFPHRRASQTKKRVCSPRASEHIVGTSSSWEQLGSCYRSSFRSTLPAIKLSPVSRSSSNSPRAIKSTSWVSQHIAIFRLVTFVRNETEIYKCLFLKKKNNPTQFNTQNTSRTRRRFKVWHGFQQCKHYSILRNVESTLKPNTKTAREHNTEPACRKACNNNQKVSFASSLFCSFLANQKRLSRHRAPRSNATGGEALLVQCRFRKVRNHFLRVGEE